MPIERKNAETVRIKKTAALAMKLEKIPDKSFNVLKRRIDRRKPYTETIFSACFQSMPFQGFP